MQPELRQGEPLSPFLFSLAAEGLNVMMSLAVPHNLFAGYTVGTSNTTVVSHLQFVRTTQGCWVLRDGLMCVHCERC